MKIYVASLSDYNAGELHGAWIDASVDIDEMQLEINAMLRASRHPNVMVTDPVTGESVPSAEEWAIHDSEGLGNLAEYAGLAEVARRVEIADVADDNDIPFNVLFEAMEDMGETDAEYFVRDKFRGSYDSWSSFAQSWTEETCDMKQVPEWLQYHIDWDSVARDFRLSGDFVGYRDGDFGELYIFYGN